ncbi:hypothetical protein CHCC14821_1251 [Bacillus paralicheniformis]|nr:hypothetical protein CHCC14821_1251 [Bacillus paralicheniformis]
MKAIVIGSGLRRISKGARMAHEGREGKARPERGPSVR